jgi:glycosyltransferase 2 family protein
MKVGPLWKKAAAALVVAAAAWFLFRTIENNWREIRRYPWHVNPLLLTASLAALVAVLAWGVFVWSRVLRLFEHPPVRVATLQRIWFLSNLARYIPGSVFQLVTAAQLSRSAGLSAAVLLTSLLVHTSLSLVAAVLVSAWMLATSLFPAALAPWVIAGASVGALTLVHPRVMNAIMGAIPRLLKRHVIAWKGTWGDGILLLALAVVSWTLYGGAYFLFVRSLTPVSPAAVPVLTGVNTLAFVAGVLTPLPGGLGVREAAMQQLLLPLLPAGVASVVSIAARLWSVGAELIGGALVLAFTRGGQPGAREADRQARR